jgi:hypothetical protein
MTQPLRDTKYARELVTARLRSGRRGKASVAIERIFVKQAKQIEIRFSSWEGSRLMPRALDLLEEELLPVLKAACQAGVSHSGPGWWPDPGACVRPAPAINRDRLGGRPRVVPSRGDARGVQVLVGSVGQGVTAHDRELV